MKRAITVIRVLSDEFIPDGFLDETAIFDDGKWTWYYYSGLAAENAQSQIGAAFTIVKEYPEVPKTQKLAKLPRWIPQVAPIRRISDPGDLLKTVLIPGEHIQGNGEHAQQSASDFTERVLKTLPPDCLYRWDRIIGEVVGDQFREITLDRMRLIIDRNCNLSAWRGRPPKTRMTYQSCNRDHAGLVIAAAVSGQVRELKMLAAYPVYGPGFIRAKPGWNSETGILYLEPDDLVGLEPEEPSVDSLIDITLDFPFREMDSRINLWGLMLTIILRPCFPTVPIHLVQSSIERTGKGMLISSIIGSLIGRHVPSVQVGEREEEREKRFTTLILEGATAIHLDNIPGSSVLDSPSLCALATTPVWKGRVLGSSSMPTLPNTLTLIASANNLRATSEVAKRIVPIWLEPATSKPEARADFHHPDIHAYAKSTRKRTISTLLGMIEAWIAAGKPRGKTRLGGFEEWAATIGGIFETAGIEGWLGNRSDWVESTDEWAIHAEILLSEWYVGLTHTATASAIFALSESHNLFADLLGRFEKHGKQTAFGVRVLRRLVDRPTGGFKVRKEKGRVSMYTIVRLTNDAV